VPRDPDRTTDSPPPAATSRPYTPADRAAAVVLLGDARPLDSPASHTHVSGVGAVDSLALWIEPAPGVDEPYLGPVITPDGPGLAFYELVLACAADAISRGYRRGYFTIKDSGLLRQLQRTFRIDPVAVGWDPVSGAASEWEVHVDLPDATEQLRNAMLQLSEGGA
jgi:hypothetical protein